MTIEQIISAHKDDISFKTIAEIANMSVREVKAIISAYTGKAKKEESPRGEYNDRAEYIYDVETCEHIAKLRWSGVSVDEILEMYPKLTRSQPNHIKHRYAWKYKDI